MGAMRAVDNTHLAAKGSPKAVEEFLLARHFEERGRAEDFFRAIFFEPDHPIPGEEQLDERQAALLCALRKNAGWKRGEIFAVIGRCDGLSLLDAGCGFSGTSHSLSKAGANVVALDVSRQRLTTGRRIAGRLKQRPAMLQGDVRGLPFPDGSFDAVLFADVFEHVREKRQVLAEARRVLRERGRIIVHTDNKIRVHLGVWARRAVAVMTLRNPWHWNVPWGGQPGGHVALATPHGLKRMMQKSGFAVRVHTRRHNIPFLKYLLSPSFFFIGTKRQTT